MPGAAIDPAALATIVFTSGTTGLPRAAMLSRANHRASADAWATVLAPRPTDTWLLSLPLHHVAGLAIVMRAHHWGTALRMPASHDADALAAELDTGVSHLSLVPTQLQDLIATWGPRRAPGALRAILLGGAPVPPTLLAEAQARGFPVLTTYGMTETASGIAVGGADAATRRDPDALRPLPGVRVRVAPDAASGAAGEILVAGAMVFPGYLGDDDAGASRLRDGWLHTGDVGRFDAEELLHVLGRRDDTIISGGENVHPAEVEAVLRSQPGVIDAAVVGRPDVRWGAVPVAVVVATPGTDLDVEVLRQACRERLAPYKVPHRVRLVPMVPRGPGGKLLREEVAALAADPADPREAASSGPGGSR